MEQKSEIVLYQPEGSVSLEVRLENETVWLTQQQISELFGTGRQAITKHLKNIFASNELDENSVCSILELTAADGKNYKTKVYNLDAILSVGYRVNSKNATLFRRWANSVLKDYMFKFWYEFIPKATSVIEMGQGEIYYKKAVKPVLHSFMGSVFEEMCRYYTLMKGIMGEYGCFITSVGTWWGVENVRDKNGEIRSQSADIDVVALSETDKKAVVGECKFKNEKIDKGIYETLIRRGKLINAKYEVTKYIFFSLSGYTDWFAELTDEDVLLLTLDSLYE